MTERRRSDPCRWEVTSPTEGPDGASPDPRRCAPSRAYDVRGSSSRTWPTARLDSVDLERVEKSPSASSVTRPGSVVSRLRRYQELEELDLPIIVLVGGATGTGKSTIATEVAYRLGITRVTSTDFVRQTMRALFSPELMPTIHHSSFEAGMPLHSAEEEEVDPLIHGFLDQTRHVLVGVKAAIDRALEEGWSMVLEGVHLVPGMLPAIETPSSCTA